MKTKLLALASAVALMSCTVVTVKSPDGSETTTQSPDPAFWGLAIPAAEKIINSDK